MACMNGDVQHTATPPGCPYISETTRHAITVLPTPADFFAVRVGARGLQPATEETTMFSSFLFILFILLVLCGQQGPTRFHSTDLRSQSAMPQTGGAEDTMSNGIGHKWKSMAVSPTCRCVRRNAECTSSTTSFTQQLAMAPKGERGIT